MVPKLKASHLDIGIRRGASWNSNGAFANGVTEQQNKEAMARIWTRLNEMECVER